MSLIDPSRRWWNSYRMRRVLAYLCWAIAVALSFVGGLTVYSDGFDFDSWGWLLPVSIGVPIPLLIAGAFLHQFSHDKDETDGRVIFLPLTLYFLAMGLGGLIGGNTHGGESVISYVFAIGGAIAVIATEVIGRRVAANERLRARVERRGVTTTGRVTRAHRYSLNYQDVVRVTVRFTDQQGNTRWASQTIGAKVSKGSQVRVRYSPDDLGRKAAVVIQPL